MKTQLQKCLAALEDLCECSKGIGLPAEIDSTIETLRETLEKNPVAYIDAADIEYMKLPGCRIVRVSNVSWDVYQVPLYRWG
jgi:hypothetical protein